MRLSADPQTPAGSLSLVSFSLSLSFLFVCLVFGVCLACVRHEKDVETMIHTRQFHIVHKI